MMTWMLIHLLYKSFIVLKFTTPFTTVMSTNVLLQLNHTVLYQDDFAIVCYYLELVLAFIPILIKHCMIIVVARLYLLQ